MSSALFWIDFFMRPANIFMLGGMAAILSWFISGGVLHTFGVNRMLSIKIMSVVTILILLLIWGAGYALVIWYNTPLGPPLELTP